MYYRCTHPVVTLFFYLGVLGRVSFVSVGLSCIHHQQCIDPSLVSVRIIVGWSLWRAAALNDSFISDYRTESSQDLRAITDPNTAGYSEYLQDRPKIGIQIYCILLYTYFWHTLYIANVHNKKRAPTDINVLQLRILTDIIKVIEIQNEIHIVFFKHCNSIVNLKKKNMVYCTFYSPIYVTTLQKAYGFWAGNLTVCLRMV